MRALGHTHVAREHKKLYLKSSHFGAMGLASSLEPWDTGSIHSPAQWIKDPAVAVAAA